MDSEAPTPKPSRRRLKWWQWLLIALGAVLVLLLIAVGIAMYVIFTPSALTKVVNRVAPNVVQCEAHFDRVNLSLFRTFPDAGLDIHNVYLVNPTPNAPTDTVARLDRLTVGVDAKRFLKEKEIIVHQVLLDGVQASLFVDSLGHSNFDIFPHSTKEDDTTSTPFSLDSLPLMDINRIAVTNLAARYISQPQGIDASATGLDLCVKGRLAEGLVDADMHLNIKQVEATMTDSTGCVSLAACLQQPHVDLQAKGNMDRVEGDLGLAIPKGSLNTAGSDMVNATLQASKHDLLHASLPFIADLQQMHLTLGQSQIKVDEYALSLLGQAQLPTAEQPLDIDLTLATESAWQVAPLLALLPEQYASLLKGIDVDAKLSLNASATGSVTDSTMPRVVAHVDLNDGRFYYPSALPYRISRIVGNIDADVDLSQGGHSYVAINTLKAHTRGSDIALTGTATNLMNDPHVDARLRGSLPFEDIMPLLPDSLPLSANGKAALDLRANLSLSQLQSQAYDQIHASGTIRLSDIDMLYDSIHAAAPNLNIALQLPAIEHTGKMAEAHITGSSLNVDMPTIKAAVAQPDINVAVNDITRQQIAAAFAISVEQTVATIDSNSIDLSALSLSGSVNIDSTQENILRRYNPSLDIDLRQTRLSTNLIAEEIYINNLDFHYTPELCDIADADFKLGHSDLQINGEVHNLEPWLSHERMLTGELNLRSNYADVDQIMDLFSGMGSDKDSIEQMRVEDSVPAEANPFIVPRDVDFTIHTHLGHSTAFENDLGDVAGSLTVKDGVVVLDQIGFVCKAATMQLTALYKTPRPNNLFAAIDFHLLDIQIDELLDMIPVVDTLVPMLAAFEGNANFHLAGESYLNAFYQPKMSTLLGSAAISGKDLVLMDDNSIAQIAKLMQFKSWKEKDNKIHIDSIDVELTCFRKEIEVFPFLINMGNYSICASGKHRLSGECGYHIELLKNPLLAKVGVDVSGTLQKPKISLGQVRYADLYKPEKQGAVEKETLALKKMIRQALENNVR